MPDTPYQFFRFSLPVLYSSLTMEIIVQTNQKLVKKVKAALDSSYSHLGGNAFGRDKRGRITKDDAALQSEMQAAGFGHGSEGSEYTAYVYYEFEL